MNKNICFVAVALLGAIGLAWHFNLGLSTEPASESSVRMVKARSSGERTTLSDEKRNPTSDLVVKVGELKTSKERVTVLGPLLTGFSRDQYSDALKAINEVRGKDRRLFNEVFDFWCKADPEGAVRWAADTMPVGRDGRLLREKAGLLWAAQDFDAAYDWARGLPDINDPWSLASGTLGILAESHPLRALSYVADTNNRKFQLAARLRILDAWAKVNPQAAYGHMASIVGRRPEYFQKISAWGQKDPHVAIMWLLSDEAKQEKAIQSILPRLIGAASKSNRREIADILYTSDGYRNAESSVVGGFNVVMCEWAKEAPEDVSGWLGALNTPHDRDMIAGALVGMDAAVNSGTPNGAYWKIPFANALTNPEQRDEALIKIAKEWANMDPDAALKWCEELAAPAVSDAALASAIGTIAETDRSRAIELISKVKSVEQKRKAVGELVSSWVETDPPAACEWILTMADGSDQIESSLIYSIQTWIAGDGVAAIRWINNKRVGENVIRGGAEYVIKNYPVEDAARILTGIENTEERDRALTQNAQRWLLINRSGAMSWLERSVLSPDQKEQLLRN